MQQFDDSAWSSRVGVAAHLDRAFIIYRRRPQDGFTTLVPANGGIYVDVLQWDDVNEVLTGGAPVEIPMRDLGYDRTGYHLWATVDPGSGALAVLCQAVKVTTRWIVPRPREQRWSGYDFFHGGFGYRPPLGGLGGRLEVVTTRTTLLVLLRAAYNSNLAAADSWRLREVDQGGYDIDGNLENGRVGCVYRREPYSVRVDTAGAAVPSSVAITADAQLGATHVPLQYQEIDVAVQALPLGAVVRDLPGGEHPQIQRTQPLAISFDRVWSGKVDLTLAGNGTSVVARPDVGEYAKMLYVHDNNQPQLFRLFTFDGRRVPRNLVDREPDEDDPTNRAVEGSRLPRIAVRRDGSTVLFTALDGFVPMFYAGLDAEAKRGNWDFLHHAFAAGSFGGLALRRYTVAAGVTAATPMAARFLDIGRAQLHNRYDDLDSTPPVLSAGENRQFRPFSLTGVAASSVDNTLGGALSVVRGAIPPRLFAYTDLGDGGCRAIFEGDVQLSPASEEKKLFALSDVTGPGVALDRTANLPIADWSRYTLPAYPVNFTALTGMFNTAGGEPGSLVCALHTALDTTVAGLTLSCGAGAVIPACARELGLVLNGADQTERNHASGADRSEATAAALTVSPASPFLGGIAHLDPALSSDPNYGLTRFDFAAPTGNLTTAGQNVPSNGRNVTFNKPGFHTVTLTVSNAGGLSAATNEVEVSLSGRPTAPLDVRATAAGGGARIQWSAPESNGASALTVYRITRTGGGAAAAFSVAAGSTRYDDASAAPLVTYQYTVAAENGTGVGRPSAPIRVLLGGAPAPLLTATRIERQVDLNVPIAPAVAATVQSVRIYRRESSGGDYALLRTVPAVSPTTNVRDMVPARRLAYEYVAVFVAAGVEGLWSRRALAWSSTIPQATPGRLTQALAGGGVQLSWQLPVLAGGATTAGYHLYRKVPGGAYPPAGPLLNALSFVDNPPGAGAGGSDAWFYFVDAENGAPTSDTVHAQICVRSVFDDLWALHPDYERLVPPEQRCAPPPAAPAEEPLVEVYDTDVLIGKHRFEYRFTSDGNRTPATVSVRPQAAWLTYLKANGSLVDVRFDVQVRSSDVKVLPVNVAPLLDADDLMSVDSVAVDLQYWRSFTLGVQMSDQRKFDPVFGGEYAAPREVVRLNNGAMLACALAAKPYGGSSFSVSRVDVELSLNWVTITLATFVAFLVILGVQVAVNLVMGALGFESVILNVATWGTLEFGIPFPIPIEDPISLTLTLLLALGISAFVANPIITGIVEAAIKKRIEESGAKRALDASGLVRHAGEGLAEEIAFRARGALGLAVDGNGRNRFAPQSWQMVAVADRVCKVIARA
jgi:PKD repeat protein